jgi:hypothetical protein
MATMHGQFASLLALLAALIAAFIALGLAA